MSKPKLDLLRLSAAADLLGLHPKTLERKLRAGELPGFKLGGSWRVSLKELKAHIDKARRASPFHTEQREEAPTS